jgi:CHAT domain-containing protein
VLSERLRDSGAEVRHLRRAFPTTEVLERHAATKAALRARWQTAPLLYFAAHVVQDPQIPYLAFLPLAATEGADVQVQDSNLEVADVRRADLRGCELVVLSGCATGAPYVGVRTTSPSLGDAFLDAGAHAVVHTYWPVRDDAAATVMAAFIDHYARSRDAVEALAWARREAADRGVDVRDRLAYAAIVASAAPRDGAAEQARLP